jgi:hypothetical protein
MVQSNDPAEVPISIHNRGSRVNVNVPNRRTSARDACTCPQAVEQRGTVEPSLTGGVHGRRPRSPGRRVVRPPRVQPPPCVPLILVSTSSSSTTMPASSSASDTSIARCRAALSSSSDNAPPWSKSSSTATRSMLSPSQPQGCRVQIKDDQPTIMNARGEDMHDRKPNRCSSAHLQSLSPCAPASIRTSGATLSRLTLVCRLRSRRRRNALFRALARMPDSIGDQRWRGEHLAVVVVWSACGTGPRTSRGG